MTNKTCVNCNEEKSIDSFYKNKNCTGGHDTTCKECFKARASQYYLDNKSVVLERMAKDWLSQKERVLRRKYNMSLQDYIDMYETQDGKCAICNRHHELFDKAKDQLVVDHDHDTGKVRKLLCNNCNTGLGMFKESTNLLKLASEYLECHK